MCRRKQRDREKEDKREVAHAALYRDRDVTTVVCRNRKREKRFEKNRNVLLILGLGSY